MLDAFLKSLISLFVPRVGTPQVQQIHYRWYADDSSDVDATTALANEDTTYEINDLGSHHLRVKIHNIGSMGSTANLKLQYNVDGNGWNDVNASSSNVRTIAGLPTEADPVSERLTTDAHTYEDGVYDDVDGFVQMTSPVDIDKEHVYSIEFRSADLSGGESIDFRLTSTGGSLLEQYLETPNCTIGTLADPPVTAVGTITITGDLAVGDDITQFAFGTTTLIGDVAAIGTSAAVWGDIVSVDVAGVLANTAVSVTLASSPDSGNLLVCLHRTDGSVPSEPSGFDVAITKRHTSADLEVQLSYKISNGGEAVLTCTSLLSSDQHIAIVQIKGPFPASFFDKTATDEGTSVNFDTGETATTSKADEVAVALGGTFEIGGDIDSWTNSFLEKVDVVSDNDHSFHVATKRLTSTGVVSAQATISGSGAWVGVIATFSEDNLSSIVTALGTITISGDLAALGTGIRFALGTATLTGDLAASGYSENDALGTSTLTGELAAFGVHMARGTITLLGEGLSEATHLAKATITLTGALDAGTDITQFALGTTTLLGDLAALGGFIGGTITAIGTITATGTMAVGGGQHKAVGTTTLTGNLAATATAIKFAVGTITITGDLISVGVHMAHGTILVLGEGISEATHLAFGVISFIGELTAGGGQQAALGTVTLPGTMLVGGGQHKATGTSTLAGDLAALATAIKFAQGTITITGDLVAASYSENDALGTATLTGELTASGVHMARGTITLLGQGLSEATHLAQATITMTGDLAAGTDITHSMQATITLIGELDAIGVSIGGTLSVLATTTLTGELVAGGGQHKAVGTSTITGDLVATATAIKFAAATITMTGDIVSRGTSLSRGTITLLGEGLSEATHLAAATITLTGALAVGGGTQFVLGITTLIGDLAAVGNLLAGKSFTKAFTRLGLIGIARMPYGSFGSKEQAAITAVGTITISGDVAARGTHLASGISTLAGELVALGTGIRFAVGTITLTGDLAASGTQLARGTITLLGEGLSEATHLAQATITLTGVLSAGGGQQSAIATTTLSGELAATATGKVFAIGTSTLIGELVADGGLLVTGDIFGVGTISISGGLFVKGFNFCPVTAKGTISIIGGAGVIGAFGDLKTVTASISITGDLKSPPPYWYSDGSALLARGTINLSGDMFSKLRVLCGINAKGSINLSGATLSAGFTDPDMKRVKVAITMTGGLGISAIYARATAISLSGSLAAIGRVLPEGTIALTSSAAEIAIAGQIGAGTIDGRKTAVIKDPYGSIELYNNSQGGFFSVSGGQPIKEVFALINIHFDLVSKGSFDQTKFGLGEIAITGGVESTGIHTAVAGIILGSGDLAAKGTSLAMGTINIPGDVDSIGSKPFMPTYNGAQSPTIVGSSTAIFDGVNNGPANAAAGAETDITLENSASDCVINIVGRVTGNGFPIANDPQVSTDIFNLNERPDSVRIRLVSAAYADSDHANYPSTAPQIGSYTDDSDFNATDAIKYGITADAGVASTDPALNPPTDQESGFIQPVVEFTFKKSGFIDLVVTYKITSTAEAETEDLTD